MNVGKEIEVSNWVEALLPAEKLAELLTSFGQIDVNADGKIDIDEFIQFSLTKEKIRLTKTFEALDADKDGVIDFEEFVAAAEPTFQLLKRFRELDLNRNGLLSIEEALNIANQLTLPLNSEQIETIMSEVDRDGDGQITYYEYLGAIAHIGFQ